MSKPAFPRAAFAPHNVGYEDVGIHDSQEGMTLRQWFAGQALAGLLAAERVAAPSEVASRAFLMADAMLALEEGEPKPETMPETMPDEPPF